MKNSLNVISLLLFVVIFSVLPACGQSGKISETTEVKEVKKLTKGERLDLFKTTLFNIKNGGLILRLSSNHNKLKEMNRLANDPKMRIEQRNYWKDQYYLLEKETKEENLKLIGSFTDKYDFSKVYFMPDTAAHLLKKGIKKGIFLNNQLEIDPSIELPNVPVGYARFGDLPRSGGSYRKALVVMYEDFNDIEGVGLYNDLSSWLPYPFLTNNPKPNAHDRMVATFNKRLKNNYSKYVGHNN
jgi:hypothetical protein